MGANIENFEAPYLVPIDQSTALSATLQVPSKVIIKKKKNHVANHNKPFVSIRSTTKKRSRSDSTASYSSSARSSRNNSNPRKRKRLDQNALCWKKGTEDEEYVFEEPKKTSNICSRELEVNQEFTIRTRSRRKRNDSASDVSDDQARNNTNRFKCKIKINKKTMTVKNISRNDFNMKKSEENVNETSVNVTLPSNTDSSQTAISVQTYDKIELANQGEEMQSAD